MSPFKAALRGLPGAEPPHASTSEGDRVHVLEILGNAIVGGMETYIERLVQRLPRDRFAVTALCIQESQLTQRLRGLGVSVYVTPMPPDEAPWLSVQTTCGLIYAQGVDVPHAHLPNAHLLAGLVCALTGRPVVATIHGRHVSTLDLEVHRAAAKHLSVVCQHSYFHALGLGVHEARLSCIANGVDTREFAPGRSDASGLRASLGIASEATLVGFVGRLSPEKGPELFVEALRLVCMADPAAHGVLVGDGPLLEGLEALVSRLGLAGRVHMAGIRENMPLVYHSLDLVASTSHSEAMPLAMIEAMSCGLPIVATRVGGVPEVLEEGRTGYGVARGDIDAIATQILRLAGNREQRLAMGRRARERVLGHFDLDDCFAGTGELLKCLARYGRFPRNAERDPPSDARV